MEFTPPVVDWAALSPILVTLGGGILAAIGTLFVPAPARPAFAAAVAALAFAAAAGIAIALFVADESGRGIVADALRRDRLGELAQILIMGAGLLTVAVSYREPGRPDRVGEYYALLLTAASGMAFFVAANDLITLFLGLEWFSISLYVLVAIATDRLPALEAGLKYLIVGSFGSAILLFGSALVYGATGAVGFEGIAAGAEDAERLFLVAGLAMLIVGLAFKASAAPFHMWTPDVYQGAQTPVSGFMSAATKVAALVVTLRLLVTAFPGEEELWTVALAVIVVASLAWGNLAALVQTDLKRLLAYSSISHAGFLLMPIAAGNALGGRALLYYLIAYSAMSVGAFAVVAVRERELGQPVTLGNLAGFGWERPFLGLSMALFMFGFIGLPPAGIFLGKFYAFSAVVDRGWAWLAVVGVIATAISIYYYAGVIRAMFMQPRELAVTAAGGSPPPDRLLVAAVGASVVVAVGTFVAADPLVEIARDAVDFLNFPVG
ncbi:MAG TPA: NADH-quinone oxidoreductase subunit N [Gaiellaceae bacterium]|nr:NADH-quinone oxidoreductase subunit N [Gaiellaceae bacterium]